MMTEVFWMSAELLAASEYAASSLSKETVTLVAFAACGDRDEIDRDQAIPGRDEVGVEDGEAVDAAQGHRA